MNNQFTTVISYEKPAHTKARAGCGLLKGEAGSLLKALGFMALWAVLTGFLVIEPLLSNPAGGAFKQDRVNFTQDSPMARSVPSTAISAPPAAISVPVAAISGPPAAISAPPAATSLAASNPSSVVKPPRVRQPAGSGSAAPNAYATALTSPQLRAQAAFNGQPFQLSYALLSLKER